MCEGDAKRLGGVEIPPHRRFGVSAVDNIKAYLGHIDRLNRAQSSNFDRNVAKEEACLVDLDRVWNTMSDVERSAVESKLVQMYGDRYTPANYGCEACARTWVNAPAAGHRAYGTSLVCDGPVKEI